MLRLLTPSIPSSPSESSDLFQIHKLHRCLVMGVPVLKVLSERRIDIDRVGEYRGRTPYIRTARTPAEISKEVQTILGQRFSDEERSHLTGLMDGIFFPVPDVTSTSFTMEKESLQGK